MNVGARYLSLATAVVAGCAVIAACAPATGINQPGSSVVTTPVHISTERGQSMQVDVTRENTSSKGYVRVPIAAAWINAQRAYASLGIPLTTDVEARHTLGNEGMNTRQPIGGKSLSRLLDCGIGSKGQNADVYGVHMSVVTQLQRVRDSSTSVVTVLHAQTTPGYDVATMECSSTGVLERQISSLIDKQ